MEQKKMIIAAARRSYARMEPSYSLVKAIGGPREVSHALGMTESRVSAWSTPKAHGGCNGRVPPDRIEAVVKLCDARKIPIVFDDAGRLCLDDVLYAKQQSKKEKHA